jgi:hypothetical protein
MDRTRARLPFADSAKGRCPRSGRRGHGAGDEVYDPSVGVGRRHLPSFAATVWTHLPEGGYRITNPRLDCPQSETVKPRTVSRVKYLQGISAISASDLPITGLPPKPRFHQFPHFPQFPLPVLTVDSVGLLALLAVRGRRHDAPPIPPRAEGRRLRTIDGADRAVILLPGYGENHTANLSISQAVV